MHWKIVDYRLIILKYRMIPIYVILLYIEWNLNILFFEDLGILLVFCDIKTNYVVLIDAIIDIWIYCILYKIDINNIKLI